MIFGAFQVYMKHQNGSSAPRVANLPRDLSEKIFFGQKNTKSNALYICNGCVSSTIKTSAEIVLPNGHREAVSGGRYHYSVKI